MTAKKKLAAVEPAVEPETNGHKDGMVEITFKDATFVIPRDRDDWPTEGLAYLSEGKYNLFTKHTLDIAEDGQWTKLCAICPTRQEFAEFFTVFGEIINEECTG